MHSALQKEFSLEGRVAVVTGAGSGIGREIALTLAQAGARIVAADINAGPLNDTLADIEAGQTAAIAKPTDVSRRADVDALANAAVEKFGRIDIWVSAAGTIVRVPIVDATDEQIDRVIAVNLKGVYAGCAAAGRGMMKQKSGSIINISSSGGESAIPDLSIYSMTKAAVNALTRTTAKELGPFGVRANVISPGWIDTPMGQSPFMDASGNIDAAKQAEGLRLRKQTSPLGITGVPRDIALAALYLASDASRFVTGQIMRPNGGVQMP
jgi:3-oxoacyl-[acyl-carrier protein] reductase